MSIFIQREESEGKVTFHVSPWPNLVATACIVVTLIVHDWNSPDGRLQGAALVGFVLAFSISLLRWWMTRDEMKLIQSKMKHGTVSISGSRWDPRTPLTYTLESAAGDSRVEPGTIQEGISNS